MKHSEPVARRYFHDQLSDYAKEFSVDRIFSICLSSCSDI
jgi:hypothetical protein